MSKICTNCNAENIDEAKFCRKCGNQNFMTLNNIQKIKEKKTNTNHHKSISSKAEKEDYFALFAILVIVTLIILIF